MLQIIINILLFLMVAIPTGHYLYKIAENKKTIFDPIFDPIDNMLYKISGINRQDMSWKEYAVSLMLTNGVMIFVGYAFLRFQDILFFNPNQIEAMEASLSFNTIVSFMTNTNLQHYSGESGLSYLSQMIVITMMMFTSAATGYAACMAMLRGFCSKPMGNYFVDMVRVTTRTLLPLAMIVGLLLVWQGSPQTLEPNVTVTTIEGKMQDLPLGPIAALESIKHLGTNGGGFLGANSSTPYENPTIISNILELLSMMLMPGACVVVFGLMAYYTKKERENNTFVVDIKYGTKAYQDAKDKKAPMPILGNEGRTIFLAMSLLFLTALSVCFWAESAGNPVLEKLGISQQMGSYEGKEVRLGIAQSAMFTTVTTSFTTGTVNNMHDTLTPLGGMIPLLNMMINTIFGGIGVGLMNMLIYMFLAVFLCGLMIGKTPEYLNKKIDSKEMKLAVICLGIHPLLILGFSALAVATPAGLEGITNPGYHGLSQVLYEYSSSAANNGSGFEGLSDNSLFWNVTAGLAMFFGRYCSIILQLAIAGSLLNKQLSSSTVGTLKTNTLSFGVVCAAVVLIFAALTFFPALCLGPVAEHLTLGVN